MHASVYHMRRADSVSIGAEFSEACVVDDQEPGIKVAKEERPNIRPEETAPSAAGARHNNQCPAPVIGQGDKLLAGSLDKDRVGEAIGGLLHGEADKSVPELVDVVPI